VTELTVGLLLDALAENPWLHGPTTAFNRLCKPLARSLIEPLFSSSDRVPQPFGPFGSLSLPYVGMGAVDSLDLFGLDELIIFAFYHANRSRYRRVLDIGANLGLHSVIMARCGFQVRAFEPDPWHFGILLQNLSANGASSVTPTAAAVSTSDGEAQFVRVLGNTTGSHLAGSKDSYGERETFSVPTVSIGPLLDWADFAKIDAEGHERELLRSLTTKQMQRVDIMVEIGNPGNAEAVFGHFSAINIPMYAQKLGWRRVTDVGDVPTSHREGSLFITAADRMPWPGAGAAV
jgi:FkbM family methyltransferase